VPINCDDGNACTNDTCDPATGLCLFAFKCAAGETCDPAVGVCVPNCDIPYVVLAGGGQNPATVDKEIMTSFAVHSGAGCIVAYTKSTLTCIPGTILYVNVKAGTGPQTTSATWNGAPVPTGTEFTIICPAVSGGSGKLVLDNKAGGGSDVDRITIKAE
jgi:hypothetical protein